MAYTASPGVAATLGVAEAWDATRTLALTGLDPAAAVAEFQTFHGWEATR